MSPCEVNDIFYSFLLFYPIDLCFVASKEYKGHDELDMELVALPNEQLSVCMCECVGTWV